MTVGCVLEEINSTIPTPPSTCSFIHVRRIPGEVGNRKDEGVYNTKHSGEIGAVGT